MSIIGKIFESSFLINLFGDRNVQVFSKNGVKLAARTPTATII
jgi:hypothetical protein